MKLNWRMFLGIGVVFGVILFVFMVMGVGYGKFCVVVVGGGVGGVIVVCYIVKDS